MPEPTAPREAARSGERTPGASSRPPAETPWRVEGAREAPEAPPPFPPRRPRFWLLVAVLLVVNWIISTQLSRPPERVRIPYTVFLNQVDAGNVAEVTSEGFTIQGLFKKPVADPQDRAVRATHFGTERPAFAEQDRLLERLVSQGVVVNAKPLDTRPPMWVQLLAGFGPTLLLVGAFVLLSRRAAAGLGGPLAGFGRSRARRYDADAGPRTTFADVAGIDEAEEELAEVVDFLRNPDKYRRLGAAIPKGVLLSGPPGTGKTLLARAVAGEAGVPFFSLSASEFIEMVVGVGASRVRDLFQQAKEAAPAIIFVDELDAIGRSRGAGGTIGGHDEREQTLNQLLTEMDGFTGSEGVIVLAATNRPEILDPALLRPGRFDRRVTVNPPDLTGRLAILRVHTRSVPLAGEVDLEALAATTPGMVGADLRNLVNEAALTAARRGHEHVTQGDFTDALEKIVLGTARSITLSAEDRERTAYHESGHALLGMLEAGADPVRKISIIPRGRALGVTFQSPAADRYAYSESYLRGRITGALGGRAAEELVYGEVTTGAESDLEQATGVARQMVGRWGMSRRVGPVSVLPRPGEAVFPGTEETSPQTRELVDAEVRRVIEECYANAVARLREHRGALDALVGALLERETLEEVDAYRIAGVAPAPRRPSGNGAAPSLTT
jgi:cell division protease FtsH